MTVMDRVYTHYEEAKTLFPEERIVGIWLQGSQNYGLDLPSSDVDTRCIIVPTFNDIALNKQPVSTTHNRQNDEHIDLKDVRKYIEHIHKQNINFLEILFTDYFVLNPLYEEQWNRLTEAREPIARMNMYRAVKAMKGIAMQKFHDMERPGQSKIDIIEKYGFDGKQVHHLIRVHDYLTRYINGESSKNCLKPSEQIVERLMAYKRQEIPLDIARKEAKEVLDCIVNVADDFCAKNSDHEDKETHKLLQDVSYHIMKTAVLRELT